MHAARAADGLCVNVTDAEETGGTAAPWGFHVFMALFVSDWVSV